MPYIKSVTFAHVGRNEGCLCDRCGQYIQNIITVHWTDGIEINYGQDCFEELYKSSRLNQHGISVMKKALNQIKKLSKELEAYTSGKMTAENDIGYQFCQTCDGGHYWKGKPYEEFRQWTINEVFPRRFEDAQKEIDRFSKVNFDR